MLKYVLALM